MPHPSILVFPVSPLFFKGYIYSVLSSIYLTTCVFEGNFEIPSSLYLALIIDKIYENLYNANSLLVGNATGTILLTCFGLTVQITALLGVW